MEIGLTRYCELAKSLYPPFITGDGISLEVIEWVEKTKNFCLPKVLRDFYLIAGNHEQINYSFNHLIGIENLQVEDGKVIFYQENQGVCEWAIDQSDLQKDDPPVWQGHWIDDSDTYKWYFETRHLSVFLTSALCWQSVMGGLPFSAVKEPIENSVVKIIEENFEPVDFGEDYKEFRAFIAKGKVLCVSTGGNEMSLSAAASEKPKFLEIDRLLQIDWDYNSLYDV